MANELAASYAVHHAHDVLNRVRGKILRLPVSQCVSLSRSVKLASTNLALNAGVLPCGKDLRALPHAHCAAWQPVQRDHLSNMILGGLGLDEPTALSGFSKGTVSKFSSHGNARKNSRYKTIVPVAITMCPSL